MALVIETNERMEVTNFYGFYPSNNPELKEAYIVATCEGIELYENGQHIINIDWIFEFLGQQPTDNEIWDYIMSECRKYTDIEKIFIDRDFADNYTSLACVFYEDFPDTIFPDELEETELDSRLPFDYDWDDEENPLFI